MPFRPYHQFANRIALERIISSLNNTGSITDEAFTNFHRYHAAMMHKLRSAKFNLVALADKLASTDLQEVASTTGDFTFEVNMFIDGFFYSSGSALDILARIVLTLFGEPLNGSIYFQTAHARLNETRPGDAIVRRLVPPPWKPMFTDYRNTLTHELILAPKCQVEIDGTGVTTSTQIVFPLPDDPRADPRERTYKKNPSVAVYAKTHFTRILTLANIIYGDIASRAEATGALPL